MVGLSPEHVCLDASRHTAGAECLCDDVAACLSVEMTFLHDVDEVVLDGVHQQGDESVSVVDVADSVFGCGPVCEVEAFAEFAEGLAGSMDRTTVEDIKGGFTLEEGQYLGIFLHVEGEEERAVGYGADVETEAEACRVAACVLVKGILHIFFLPQR